MISESFPCNSVSDKCVHNINLTVMVQRPFHFGGSENFQEQRFASDFYRF